MGVLRTLLKKEFKQIFRNKTMLPIIFIVPVVQMIILVYAASLDMKNVDMAIVDMDHSQASLRLVSHFKGSSMFTIKYEGIDYRTAEEMLIQDRADVVLHIYRDFEKNLINEKETDLQLVVNAINITEAGLINAYSTQIISDYNQKIRSEWFSMNSVSARMKMDLSVAYWYNPLLDYKIYMFSGILVIIVTMIGMILTALNLVREKELGTAEQMNVTPMKKYQFLVAKLLPFLLIALFELSFGLLLGHLLFALPIRGSLLVLFAIAIVYLICALGLGLFLSTVSNTQQQMMFMAFFFMITFILMSGVFTPADSMPAWAQKVNLLNPVAYFMKAIRMILLKGSGFADIAREFYSLLVYGIIIMSLSILNYRKTT
ncbi:ABC transporter permease [Bacteroidota bacterium]